MAKPKKQRSNALVRRAHDPSLSGKAEIVRDVLPGAILASSLASVLPEGLGNGNSRHAMCVWHQCVLAARRPGLPCVV